jgi:hypothetical protein
MTLAPGYFRGLCAASPGPCGLAEHRFESGLRARPGSEPGSAAKGGAMA